MAVSLLCAADGGNVDWNCALIPPPTFTVSIPNGFPLAVAAQPIDIKIAYWRRPKHPETVSLLQMISPNGGLAGAEMAIDDDNTIGRFPNQHFTLTDVYLKKDVDVVAAVQQPAGQHISLVIADLPADVLLTAADAGKELGIPFFNRAAPEGRLRPQDCCAVAQIRRQIPVFMPDAPDYDVLVAAGDDRGVTITEP
jgi:hypothetical protein